MTQDLAIPEATLSIQAQLTSPPVPSGVAVMVGETVVAVVSIAELRRAALRVDEMEVAASIGTFRSEFFP